MTKKSLAKHPIQFQILEEILLQLETFENHANKIGNKEITNKFKAIHKIILTIFNEKCETINDSGERDDSLKAMENYMDRFEKM